MTARYDAAIVGARVAGSITATLLGEAGLRVLLVDAARFPSDTISTHFFRGAGLVGALRRLGVLDEVLALGAPPLTRQYDFGPDSAEPEVGGPQDPGDVGYALSCRRVRLDRVLVERARRTAGVEVLEGTPVRDLVHDGAGRVVGLVLQRDGAPTRVAANLVVGADGRGSFVARAVEASVERTEPASRAMYFRYLRDYAPPQQAADGPEFSIIGDEIAYAFPSDDDVTCLAVSINLAGFDAFRAHPEASYDARIRAHPGFAKRYIAARPDSRVLGSGPKDAVIRTPVGPGWALVGDAGLHQDPWTGLGMDNAAKQATFLAEAAVSWLCDGTAEADALATYRARRDESAMAGFDFTASAGRDLAALA
ncbi:MAG TPA: NAD(P)/FAD-dependent oxidoreductase [Candidatus Limnocylindrales bacterium]|nr:NAD(P)/FAD-dependent oxidoreductase [Candidatus Limnocylindrales bacterium]